jgi:hypothetical protein
MHDRDGRAFTHELLCCIRITVALVGRDAIVASSAQVKSQHSQVLHMPALNRVGSTYTYLFQLARVCVLLVLVAELVL